MDYEYEYTKILDSGDWEDLIKPIFYEFPRVLPDKVIYTRRCIYVQPITKDADERSIGREVEASDSHDMFKIILRSPNQADFLSILDKLRKIHVNQQSTTYTEVRFAGDVKESPGYGTYTGSTDVVCFRTGKFIGEY